MSYNLWNNSSFEAHYSIFNNLAPHNFIVANVNMDENCWSLRDDNNNHNNERKISTSDSSVSLRTTSNEINRINEVNGQMNQMCTLYLDMTYDDRVFFGVHNFFLLKYSLSESQCNVDFSAANNKVSIVGHWSNVAKMCKSFFLHSTFAVQFEFYYYDDANCFEERFKFFQKEYEKWDVYVSFRQDRPNVLLFNFLTFRKFFIRLIQTMINFQMQLEFHHLGKVLPNIMSTLQIPVIRRDSNGITNAYIESVENETRTKIKTIRYHDSHHYPFENVIITGTDIFSVIQARWLLTARFEYELKFQVGTKDTGLLVKVISNLKYDRSAIDITIMPCTLNYFDSKILAIKGNEKNIDDIFNLRSELLDSMMMANYQKFSKER